MLLLKKKNNGSIQYGIFTIITMFALISLSLMMLYERQTKSVKYQCDNNVITASLAANKIDVYSYATNEYILMDTGVKDCSVQYGSVDEIVTEQFKNACFKAYDTALDSFTSALKTNMSLDDNLHSVNSKHIQAVKIVDFRIYNVIDDDVFEINKTDSGYTVEPHLNTLNNYRCPSGDIIGASGLYVKVEVQIDNALKKGTSKFYLTSYVDSKKI